MPSPASPLDYSPALVLISLSPPPKKAPKRSFAPKRNCLDTGVPSVHDGSTMLRKLKRGDETIRIQFKVARTDWGEFRACAPGLSPSEQVRLALRQFVKNNKR